MGSSLFMGSAIKNLDYEGFKRYISWGQKGGMAVLDQGLFAGTNFLVGILLARWLEPAAYGAFSTAYSIFLFVGILHNALWTEPMLIYGSGRFREQYIDYQKVLLTYHWRFALISTGLFSLFSFIFFISSQLVLARSFIGLAIASPLILYLWLVRRSAYILLKPQYAVFGGSFYLVLYLGISYTLFQFQWLNELTALGTMGLSALISGYLINLWIHRKENYAPIKEPVNNKEALALHLGYGKWALAAGVSYWIPGNLMFLLLPLHAGLESVGTLSALMNFIMPLAQFNSAFGPLLLPVLVKAREDRSMLKVLYTFAAFQSIVALIYWVILGLFNSEFTFLLYKEHYSENSRLLWYLGLLPLFSGLATVLSAGLRARGHINKVFWAYTIGVILILPVYIWLGLYHGVLGAVWGFLLSFISINFALWIALQKTSD